MIHLLQDGPIAVVTLDRGAARNALPIAGWDTLAETLGRIGDARAVILRSEASGIFSAGADIGEFARLRDDPDLRVRFRQAMRAGIEAVAALPMPVIAAIDGGCFGAAVALTLAADIRIAGDDAVFAITPARLGIGYPQADVARLVTQIGRGQASRLLFTAERIDADAAAQIGLVEARAQDAGAAAQAMALRIAANAPGAVRLLKRMVAGSSGLDAQFDAAFGGAEFAEGLRAFQDKREADFR
ncbi:enoyl-CoA hydratase/isomerase family protein [Sphingomonas sp. S2-65]|uniref:enoyl-CoA hydratase/isomerase family protein n=1 Tax=Sphingomonas sp. S2-65 TaxID=2903960 RepID=UPI001F339725|nr:enoyl-CoA hydratase/isomerase family protein [Sphingomonas sp. S2-65]UYY59130.1 enoyl-CoA hydratase/isomerase family protein [Sphingomonas sp. S2-65]